MATEIYGTDKGLIIDLFAGGGGASVGMEMAFGRSVDIAVNHDPKAILMHRTNHPETIHLTEDVFEVDLEKYINGRHVSLLWASPDCTQFSKAKGGKPRMQGIRVLPWAVYKHAKAIKPSVIIMENVEEIQQWGPLDDNGHPIKECAGEEYKRFVKAMMSLGYDFDCRELVAADYGAPTIRKRWYAVFRCDGLPIVWPEPTHSRNGEHGLKKWEPIYKYLDLENHGPSIFKREENNRRPLAEATKNRIARGVVKYVLNDSNPFIVTVNEDKDGKYADQELASVFLTKFYKSGTGQTVNEPIHTITTSPGHFGQVSCVMVPKEQFEKAGINEEAAETCTCVSQFLMEYYGCGTGQNINLPIHTIVTKDRFALVTVVMEKYVITDIHLRMLEPEELKRGQGFPDDYIVSHTVCDSRKWHKYSKADQVARIGNSVVPVMAKALAEANCWYLKVGERVPNPCVYFDISAGDKWAKLA